MGMGVGAGGGAKTCFIWAMSPNTSLSCAIGFVGWVMLIILVCGCGSGGGCCWERLGVRVLFALVTAAAFSSTCFETNMNFGFLGLLVS